MIRFARKYVFPPFLQQPAAKLQTTPGQEDTRVPQAAAKMAATGPTASVQQLAAQIPWFHNSVLMEKVKDLSLRAWYMQQTIEQGWSRNVLTAMIQSNAHERQGTAVTNFAERLPPAQSDLQNSLSCCSTTSSCAVSS